jgi:hypothetical protein
VRTNREKTVFNLPAGPKSKVKWLVFKPLRVKHLYTEFNKEETKDP